MGTAGQLIVKRYRLVRALGQGRAGVVWEGLDTLLDRPVAIREVLLPPDLRETARLRLVQRLSREVRQVERLRHPHIAAVHDMAEEDGTPYIVTELVRSRSLDGIVTADGPLAPAEAARTARVILSALAHAHASGVRHGDVRPANVLVGHDGRVLLADFGISALAADPVFARPRREPAHGQSTHGQSTHGQSTHGRPAYGAARDTEAFLAPERATGGPRTIAADLWSLGATLHLAVTGRPPSRPPDPAADLPAELGSELEAVLTGLLAREPRRRLDAETAGRMLAEAEPPPPVPPVRRSRGRTRLVTGVAAAVLVACAAGGWAALRPGGESRATEARPPSPSAIPSPSATSREPARRLKLKWYESDAGWRAGVPRGWARTREPYSMSWRAPGGEAAFTVEVTAQSGTDPLAALGEAEAILRPTARAYRKLALRSLSSEYGPAADWEFTWTPRKGSAREHLTKGTEYHQFRRVISTGTTTSVLTWTTTAAGWDALRPTLVRVFSLFRPPSAS